MPKKNQIEINHCPIHKGLRHRQGLSDNDQPSPIHPVGDDSPEGSEKQPRKGVEEADHAQKKGGMGQLPNEPALCDVLHEVPCVRKNRAHQQETEIAMSKGAKGCEFRKVSSHRSLTGFGRLKNSVTAKTHTMQRSREFWVLVDGSKAIEYSALESSLPQMTTMTLKRAVRALSCALAISLAAGASRAAEPRPIDGISDNSFLVEEAYNQDPGVVQHIFNAVYGNDFHRHGWSFNFTQEWPLYGVEHQISYSIPFSHLQDNGQQVSG